MSEVRKSMDVSHGRGGAGNMAPDDTKYVDGEIVRAGHEGDQGAGAYSTGRGGAANIGSPHVEATKRNDTDSIPEAALRHSSDENHHVGRGGEGNKVEVPAKEKESNVVEHPVGLADKLKRKLFGKK